jgi:hypothetical protein
MRNPRVTAILSRMTDSRGRPATLPARLCAECLSALPISGVSVTMTTAEGSPGGMVLAATDRRARQLEESQASLGEGPGVDAADAGRPLLHSDLPMSGPTRWPKLCKAVLSVGICAVLAFPLAAGAERLGVLTLYRDIPGRLTNVDLADALAFAEAATAVLRHLRARSGLDAGRPATTGPGDPHATVQRATGMVMIQLGVTPAEALQRLRAHTYATGRTITAVAADVVGHRLRFGDAGSARGNRPASGDPRGPGIRSRVR